VFYRAPLLPQYEVTLECKGGDHNRIICLRYVNLVMVAKDDDNEVPELV
jgi:hypothetical protein